MYLFLLVFIVLLGSTVARDYCVIGAGPAGLQSGYFLERAGRDYVIFERDSTPGWFYKIFPRHRTLISINKRWTGKTNKEFNLRHDWNSLISDNEDLLMTKYSKEFFPPADTMVQYLKDFAEKLNLKVQYDTYIRKILKDDEGYILYDQEMNKFFCKYLIISTGLSVENYPRFVPGIEHTISYANMSIDPDNYEGQNILIIGRGNSAFETAQHLQGAANIIHMMSRGRLRLSWQTHYVGDVRAVNDGPIDTYQLKSLDGQLEGDLRDMVISKVNDKMFIGFKDEADDFTTDLATRQSYDTIIRCTGFKFDGSIFEKDVRPEKSKVGRKFPRIKPNYESATSENMFFAGTITHSIDIRKSAGGFIHGFRYTARALHHLLEWRNHGVHWPSVVLPMRDLINYLTKRLNEGSGIYQMTAALCDVIAFCEGNMFEYFKELPVGILHEFEKHTGRPFVDGIVARLEYGKNFSGPGADPFREDRATEQVQDAHSSNFLHPVLYYYKGGIPKPTGLQLQKPLRLHHIVEDFLTEWIDPVQHLLPLRWFLEYCTGLDLRRFYAESCFEFAMIGSQSPHTCQHEYIQGSGSSLFKKPEIAPRISWPV